MPIELKIGNAAGTAKYPDEILAFSDTVADRIMAGTYTAPPGRGNIPIDPAGKVFWFDDRSRASTNSVNLKNPGVEATKNFLPGVVRTLHAMKKELYASGAGTTPEEYALLTQAFIECGADGMEVNLKLVDPTDSDTVDGILAAIKEAREWMGVELKIACKVPQASDLQLTYLTNAFTRSGIVSEVVAANTLQGQQLTRPDGSPALSYRAEEGGPILHTGGTGGEPVRKRALEIVELFAGRDYLPGTSLTGVGGIFTGRHAALFLGVGASRVQCATACFMHGPRVLNTIAAEYKHLVHEAA